MKERRLPPPNEDYAVTDDGRIFSHKRYGGARRELVLTPNTYGYMKFSGCGSDGRIRNVYVHQVVAELFLGPPPPGCEVAHENGLRTDNHVENLRWATKTENYAGAVTHETNAQGERHGMSKLTAANVLQIRKRYMAGGVTYQALGVEFGVSLTTIWDVVRRKTWRHLLNGEEI